MTFFSLLFHLLFFEGMLIAVRDRDSVAKMLEFLDVGRELMIEMFGTAQENVHGL